MVPSPKDFFGFQSEERETRLGYGFPSPELDGFPMRKFSLSKPGALRCVHAWAFDRVIIRTQSSESGQYAFPLGIHGRLQADAGGPVNPILQDRVVAAREVILIHGPAAGALEVAQSQRFAERRREAAAAGVTHQFVIPKNWLIAPQGHGRIRHVER